MYKNIRIFKREQDRQDETLKKRRPWYILALGLFVLSLFTRQPLAFLAALFTLLIGLVPDLWYRRALHHLVVRQSLNRHQVFFGEEITLALSIENRKFLPLPWLRVANKIVPPLTILPRVTSNLQIVRKDTLAGTWLLWSLQRVTRVYRMQCQERGFHTFGPVELESSDPFGWLACDMTVAASEALLVYPLLAPLESFGFSSHHPLGESVLRSSLFEDPLRFAGVRDYALGDDPRRVHWKATAHAGALRSKIYEPPALRRLLILLDVWNYAPVLHGPDLEIQELTIAAAASLAMWALDAGYMVGLLVNCAIVTAGLMGDGDPGAAGIEQVAQPELSSGGIVSVPFASEYGQYERLLATLGRLVPRYSSVLETVIERENAMFAQGTTILLVSAASTLHRNTLRRLLEMRTRRGAGIHLALPDESATQVATHGLPVHYLGGKERWHELIRAAGGEKNAASVRLQLD